MTRKRISMFGLRIVDADVVTLGPTAIVVTAWQPTWWGKLLGKAIECRTCSSAWPGASVFEWDDSGRVLSDRELAVVTAAIDRARLQRQLDEIAARPVPHLRIVN